MSATGFGAGKLILVGEHAVVHGAPAIAFAVDLGTTATLVPRPGPLGLPDGGADPTLRRAVATLLGEEGYEVGLSTTLPIGRGMGSSAALAVALVRAWHTLRGTPATPADEQAAAMPIERVFHATPSGLDVAVSVHGGVIRYRRGPPMVLEALPTPSWRVVVLDSGRVGVTSALVAGVTARRPGIDPTLARIGALVDHATAVIDDPAALGPLLDENHALLRAIGVSTPELDDLCALARRHGALGAKLSGAGGGGVVLALVHDPGPLLRAARAAGVPAWTTSPEPRP